MVWQQQTFREVASRLPAAAFLEMVGSAADPSLVDGWSDLDLHLRLPFPVRLVDLFGQSVIWAAEISDAPDGQVVRVVLADGRRIDLVVEIGRLVPPALARDNDVRFLAALAVTKLGRGDRLIGTHLVLELMQACLVQAMLLRDRDEGTTVHRTGGPRDSLVAEVAGLTRLPLKVTPRPNIVERTTALYAKWRAELERDYRPDWGGLEGVLRRGLG